LLHTQDLNHADENVDEIQFQRDALIDSIALHDASLSQARVVQDFLDIVEGEASKDCESTIKPEVLGEHQCSNGGSWDDKRSKAGKSNDCDTGKERCAEVQVFLLLGCGSNESDATHHTSSVKTSASEEGWLKKKERAENTSLHDVEDGPESVLLDIAIRMLVLNLSEVLRKLLTCQVM
jgi:hypothetical protein